MTLFFNLTYNVEIDVTRKNFLYISSTIVYGSNWKVIINSPGHIFVLIKGYLILKDTCNLLFILVDKTDVIFSIKKYFDYTGSFVDPQ